MTLAIGIIIGALIVLFVPFTLSAMVGLCFIGMAMYFAPEGFGRVIVSAILLWLGLHLIF